MLKWNGHLDIFTLTGRFTGGKKKKSRGWRILIEYMCLCILDESSLFSSWYWKIIYSGSYFAGCLRICVYMKISLFTEKGFASYSLINMNGSNLGWFSNMWVFCSILNYFSDWEYRYILSWQMNLHFYNLMAFSLHLHNCKLVALTRHQLLHSIFFSCSAWLTEWKVS